MGTKMAPAYTNLSKGKLEDHLTNVAKNHIHTWKRFIDDNNMDRNHSRM